MAEQSQKRVMIDAANKRVIIVTAIAAFVVIFSLVASQALFSQMLYQNRIVKAKKQALSQLKANEAAVANLQTAYSAFIATPQNIIGGSTVGTGPKDGDNAKIILDALPSKYDFPALATSLEKLVTDQGLGIKSITGTDDEIAQAGANTSGKPQPVPMPFELSAGGSLEGVQNFTSALENSIRPIQIKTMTVTGSNTDLTVTVGAQTYYQPGKVFSVGKTTIK